MSDTTEARASASITIVDGVKFDLARGSGWTSLHSGTATIFVEGGAEQACSDLINQLFEAIAHLRHESANAKRCEARGAA